MVYSFTMLIETTGRRIRLVSPRSFAGLMTLYESNHARLRQLLGNLWPLPAALVSVSPSDLNVHLTLVGRSRYTTRWRMSYRLELDGAILADPDLLLCIYHDARLVEAVSCCEQRRHHALTGLPVQAPSEMERRWLLNILLNKWLAHCLDHRHVFS